MLKRSVYHSKVPTTTAVVYRNTNTHARGHTVKATFACDISDRLLMMAGCVYAYAWHIHSTLVVYIYIHDYCRRPSSRIACNFYDGLLLNRSLVHLSHYHYQLVCRLLQSVFVIIWNTFFFLFCLLHIFMCGHCTSKFFIYTQKNNVHNETRKKSNTNERKNL